MSTIKDVLERALGAIGIKGEGQTLDADDLSLAFDYFNMMLDQLATQGLTVYGVTRNTQVTVSGQDSYTIGLEGTTTADWTVARPQQLLGAFINDQDNDFSSGQLFQAGMIEMERMKTNPQDGNPQYVNYDPQYPLGEINFYPNPDGVYSVKLLYNAPLTKIDWENITDDWSFPPGWEAGFMWNLALQLTVPFSVPIPPLVASMAAETFRRIKNMTAAQKIERVNLGLMNLTTKRNAPYNIIAGQ